MSIINWKGHEWQVQDWTGAPTYNKQWSADNVVENPDGSITLKVTNPTGTDPIAASFESTQRGWGYGTYTSVIEGDFDNMPDSIVLGNLYTYDGTKAPGSQGTGGSTQGSSANEIDAGEISSWGEIDVQPTLSSTVWHDDTNGDGIPENEHAYSLPFPTGTRISTHVFIWEPDRVSFYAYKGRGTGGPLIAQGAVTVDVPVPAREAILFNMWVTDALENDQTKTGPFEVTFHDFSFVPLTSKQDFTLAARLEVEAVPTGLVNKINNPDGAKGAWGWLSPVPDTTIKAERGYTDGSRLVFAGATSVVTYYYSELMPVDVGDYVAARVTPRLMSPGTGFRLRFEFTNTAGSVIASTVPTALRTTVPAPLYIPAAVAPAGSVYVRLRVDLQNGTGGNPAPGSYLHLNQIMVVATASTGLLSVQRINLLTNPSFEAGLTGWTVDGDVTTGAPAAFDRGTGALLGAGASVSVIVPVLGGTDYYVGFNVRGQSGADGARVNLAAQYRNSAGQPGTTFEDTYNQGNVWARRAQQLTTPSTARSVRLTITAVDYPIYLDAVIMEKSQAIRSYFDGATTDTTAIEYSWTGTEDASTSIATAATDAFDFVEPVQWINVLGSAYEIKVHREGLDVGTLTATLLDATLDPSQSDAIRPGRQVRLTAKQGTVWRPVFTGRLDSATVKYNFLAPKKNRTARIEIVALDNVAQLAGVSRASGVADLDDLPWLLEGASVPWNVNASGDQVSIAQVAATNESATCLDQVSITRDTELAYVWVDPDNVLQAWNTLPTENDIANPGFEQNTAWWVAQHMSKERVTTERHRGNASLKVKALGTGKGRLQTDSTLDVLKLSPNDPYSISAWYKVPAALSQDYRLVVEFYSDFLGWGYLGEVTSAPLRAVTNGWEKREVRFTAPSGATRAICYPVIANASSSNATDTIYVDDVEFLGGLPVLGESDYDPGVNVSFDTRDLINSVTVKWLRYYADKGATKEVFYGPYRDTDSIDEWGARGSTFTIQGVGEGQTAAAAYAGAILAANANPVVRVNSLTTQVRLVGREVTSRAFLDLYDLVKVVNGSLESLVRIESIEHVLEPGLWTVDLAFRDAQAKASPLPTPSAENVNASFTDEPSYGRVTITPAAADVWTDKYVAYATAYRSAPLVFTTLSPSGNPDGLTLTAVTDESQYGVTLWVRSSTTTPRRISWQAIPQ